MGSNSNEPRPQAGPAPTKGLSPLEAVASRSAAMHELTAMIRRVAASGTTVLIEGESGTGKEVAATSLHHFSGRAGPFVAINCGSMSADLLDSELFGHVRGAFTGATQSREGLFMHAGGGTLFLDEVSELPLSLQAKLLRVLEVPKIRPVGTDAEVPIDVRIVAATNKPMATLVQRGAFREDLYYRLNVLALRVPPLRERPEDIESLVTYFSDHFSSQFDLPPVTLSRAGLQKLQSHSWPGNVRELRNLVERALLLGKTPEACLHVQSLDARDIQNRGGSGYSPELPLAEVRKQHMTRVLSESKGNKSEAARRMGISRKTLERKLREWETA